MSEELKKEIRKWAGRADAMPLILEKMPHRAGTEFVWLEDVEACIDEHSLPAPSRLRRDEQLEKYEDMFQQIESWTRAYPIKVFPEPDWEKVRAALEAEGITLDSVSASNMRHVIDGIRRIIDAELREEE